MPADSLKTWIDQTPFIDSHSHMAGMDLGSPLDDRKELGLGDVLAYDYLAYLSSSCVNETVMPTRMASEDARRRLSAYSSLGDLLQHCRGLSTYAALREGIRELHPFHEQDITPENWDAIDAHVRRSYREHGERAWQRRVMRRAGIIRQAHICQFPYVTEHWDSLPEEDRRAQQAVLLPSLVLDGLAFTGFVQSQESREHAKRILGMRPTSHQEHIDFCEAVLDRFVQCGGNSVKILAAYTRSLRIGDAPDPEAARIYTAMPDRLSRDQLTFLQDNLLGHLIRMSVERRLPVLVHTGYSIPTAWGDPENLLPLFQKPELRHMRLALCHAGWPHDGKALLLARTFRGCYLDLSWMPLLSPVIARNILSEAIDVVPANKILIGTDCATAEMFLGTVRQIRSVLAEVLGEKVERGQFGMDAARHVAKAILLDNPAEFFGVSVPRGSAPMDGDDLPSCS